MSSSSEPVVRKIGIGILGTIMVGIVIASLAAAGYFYYQYQTAQSLQKNPTVAAQKEVAQLIAAVGKHIELPQDEAPTLATVSDVTKLKGQTFFRNARNGDKVLIYTKAKKAFLYDPKMDKLVEVGPVNTSPSAANTTKTASASATPSVAKVVISNGTTITGLGATAEKQLTSAVQNISVTDKTNASKTDYEVTTVVDITGKNSAVAKQIAESLKGTVSTLPTAETRPANADILVILGKNYTGK